MRLGEYDECPSCHEDVMVIPARIADPVTGEMRSVRLLVEPNEIQALTWDDDFTVKAVVAYERHLKHCKARIDASSGAAAPPDDDEKLDVEETEGES